MIPTEQLYPQVFDGAKMAIQKGLSRYFQTIHTITLGSSVQPTQWQFGTTYVGSKEIGENDVSCLVMCSGFFITIIWRRSNLKIVRTRT